MAKPLASQLVPSFSQHNLCLVVLGRCLHVLVTKFQDKFASLRQVNSPYSWNKFQICCTDMYLIRFLPNFAVFFMFLWILQDFADLPEFHGSTTARNIRSPVNDRNVMVNFKPGEYIREMFFSHWQGWICLVNSSQAFRLNHRWLENIDHNTAQTLHVVSSLVLFPTRWGSHVQSRVQRKSVL